MKNFQNINFSLIQHSCLFHIWRKKKIRTTFTGKWSTFEQRKSNNHHWLTSINYYSRKNTVERNSIEIPSTIYTTFPLNGVTTRWDIHLKPEDLFFFFFFFNQDERSIRTISPSRLCNLRIFPNNTILAKIRFHPPFFSSSKRNHWNLTSTNQTISNIPRTWSFVHRILSISVWKISGYSSIASFRKSTITINGFTIFPTTSEKYHVYAKPYTLLHNFSKWLTTDNKNILACENPFKPLNCNASYRS